MLGYLIFSLFLLVALIAYFLLLFFTLIALVRTSVPFISTPDKKYAVILGAVNLRPGEVIYDLGCGRASLLVRAARDFGAKGVGYELGVWPYLWSHWNIWRAKVDVLVLRQDFFGADLKKADVVFCYLLPHVMTKLEPKFKNELKPGTRVITYSFPLPTVSPAKIILTDKKDPAIGRIFVYHF